VVETRASSLSTAATHVHAHSQSTTQSRRVRRAEPAENWPAPTRVVIAVAENGFSWCAGHRNPSTLAVIDSKIRFRKG